ncbi:uncharacterized protein LOC134474561 [Cavia porcellus]|uniref:uncharacterized protein LOC134474561 n=1 Tax=Cavia porcellus TaxID=10141 RepID=UPI002FE30C2D
MCCLVSRMNSSRCFLARTRLCLSSEELRASVSLRMAVVPFRTALVFVVSVTSRLQRRTLIPPAQLLHPAGIDFLASTADPWVFPARICKRDWPPRIAAQPCHPALKPTEYGLKLPKTAVTHDVKSVSDQELHSDWTIIKELTQSDYLHLKVDLLLCVGGFPESHWWEKYNVIFRCSGKKNEELKPAENNNRSHNPKDLYVITTKIDLERTKAITYLLLQRCAKQKKGEYLCSARIIKQQSTDSWVQDSGWPT